MSKTEKVRIRLGDGSITECSLEYDQVPPWRLRLSGLNLKRREFEGSDLFEALVELRRGLETVKAQLLCAGARPDVFPSGMSRGMGGGRAVYVTRIGQQALKTDLVDIFDYAEPDIVGTVEEQMAFHKRWVEALKFR